MEDSKWVVWAIEQAESDTFIAIISIWNIDSQKREAELGYGIALEFEGKGFMREALLAAIDYGFRVMQMRALKVIDKVDDPGYVQDKMFRMLVYRIEAANGNE
jgi:ribosomal-protein-alanine N-acetyltransferase